ncbi:unnamed protein product [Lactuca saligna]|uniref:BHLH domain-containing protein n=1 Tax=Lactuca saligna TaxID=75948 RepID=A0AA35YZ89_LACSI|nr:unnamed protein product [Lactuca saligna]
MSNFKLSLQKINSLLLPTVIHLDFNLLISQVLMDSSPAWLSEMEMEDSRFLKYDHMSTLYDTIDNFSVDSLSSQSYKENMTSVVQSFQKISTTNKKHSSNPEPLIATNLPSSNTFTISFGDLKCKNKILQINDSLAYESANATKIPTIARNQIQAQDHVLAERKRREKLNKHFISLSSLLPSLKKMDKASVLEDACNYIKELHGRVKELEGLSSPKRKNLQSSVISMKRSKLSTSDDEYYSTDDTNSCDTTNPFKLSPEIEVRMSGSSVLVKIECEKNFSSFVKALNQMQKLGLTNISSSAMPFAKTRLLINIVSQIEDGFCMTPTELVKHLQLAI